MKSIWVLIIVGTMLTACGSKKEKTAIDKDVLSGTWIFAKANLIDQGLKEFKPLLLKDYEDNTPVLNIIEFDNTENLWIDTGGQSVIKGKYKMTDSLLTLTYENNILPKMQYTVMPSLDTLRYRIYKDYKIGTDKIVYELSQISLPVKDVAWRKPLPPNADDATIKEKLRDFFKYYLTYCQNVNAKNKQFFFPDRINMPFYFLGYGLGLQQINDWDPEFKQVIGEGANLQNTNRILSNLFQTIKDYEYPDTEFSLIGYADFFAYASRTLQKQ
jgi:hypothetical protein